MRAKKQFLFFLHKQNPQSFHRTVLLLGLALMIFFSCRYPTICCMIRLQSLYCTVLFSGHCHKVRGNTLHKHPYLSVHIRCHKIAPIFLKHSMIIKIQHSLSIYILPRTLVIPSLFFLFFSVLRKPPYKSFQCHVCIICRSTLE